MKRGLIASLLIVHGLAHASIGVWAAADGTRKAVNLLWALAIVGYLATSFAMLRLPLLRRHWKQLLLAATTASMILLVLFGGKFGLLGIPIDLVLLFLALDVMGRRVDADVEVVEAVHVQGLPHPVLHRLGWGLALVSLCYVAAVVALRPIYLRWGTTPAERIARLPGDEPTREARYRVDHGITIRAPADSVWPWLVQLAQDSGRVKEIVPGRSFMIEGRGAFVLQPVDSTTTRFFVRTRGEGTPSLTGFLLGPLSVFVFEPAHFVIQRGMLRGVRDRAEGRIRGAA